MKQYGTKNLTITQRRILERCLQMRMHKREIAKMLGVCLATVYNEIKRGLYEHKTIKSYDCIGEPQYKYETRYSADIAQQRYELNQTTHGMPIKLGNDYDFVRYVEKRVIQDKISPCAVCGEIKRLTVQNGCKQNDHVSLYNARHIHEYSNVGLARRST